MKFEYLGDVFPMNAFGFEFVEGEATEVTDEFAIKKLSSNSHFKSVGEDEKKDVYLKKAEIIEKLEEAGIEFDPSMKRDELLELLNDKD